MGTPPQATVSPARSCRLGWLGQRPTCHVFVQIRGRCDAKQRAHPDAWDWVSQSDQSGGLGCTGQPDMAPHRHYWFSACQQRVTLKLQHIKPLNAHVVHRIFSRQLCLCVRTPARCGGGAGCSRTWTRLNHLRGQVGEGRTASLPPISQSCCITLQCNSPFTKSTEIF